MYCALNTSMAYMRHVAHKRRLQRRVTTEFLTIMRAHGNCVPSRSLWCFYYSFCTLCVCRIFYACSFICVLQSLLLKDNVFAWKVCDKQTDWVRQLTVPKRTIKIHINQPKNKRKKSFLLYFDFCLCKMKWLLAEISFMWNDSKWKWNWYAICCALMRLEFAIKKVKW